MWFDETFYQNSMLDICMHKILDSKLMLILNISALKAAALAGTAAGTCKCQKELLMKYFFINQTIVHLSDKDIKMVFLQLIFKETNMYCFF